MGSLVGLGFGVFWCIPVVGFMGVLISLFGFKVLLAGGFGSCVFFADDCICTFGHCWFCALDTWLC